MKLLPIAAAALLAAAPALAQEAPPPGAASPEAPADLRAPRVLHRVETEVKGPAGPAVYRFTTTYNPAAGEYVRLVEDAATGVVLRRQARPAAMVAPTREEQAWAEAVIADDAEIAAEIGRAQHPVQISGGFPLTREAGAPFCGPGSRCLQYDVLEMVPGEKAARRIRFVVVDLRDGALVARGLDPAWEGNLANPAVREASRARGVRFPTDSE